MARLTMRDGTTIQVPDNATPDQVQLIVGEYGKQQREASAQGGRESAWEDTPMMEKLAVGFAKPFIETGKGIKSLFTDLNQDDRNALDAGKGVSGAAGTAGELAGNVAMLAVPGGYASQGGRAAAAVLPRALGLRAAARAAPEIGAMAGMEALKAPTDDRSRGDAAMEAAVGAGVGIGAGKALKTALGGVPQSTAAKAMLESGTRLTPGQAAGGSFIPWLEQRMAAIPIVGGRVAKLQRTALDDWNLTTLKSAAPPNVEVTSAGQVGFQQLQKAFQESYDALWDQKIPLASDPSALWVKLLEDLPSEATSVSRNLAKAGDALKASNALAEAGKNNGTVLSQLDDMLRDFAQQAMKQGDDEALNVYRKARSSFRAALPDNVSDALSDLDTQYAKYAIVQRAATGKKALETAGIFTPADLMGAVKAKSAARSLARGDALLQKEAEEGVKVFRNLTPGRNKMEQTIVGGLAAGGALLHPAGVAGGLAAGSVLPTETMRKLILGKANQQKMIALMRRYGATSATTGAALSDSDD